MLTTKLKVITLAVILIIIVIQENLGSYIARNVEIHVTNVSIPIPYTLDRCIPVLPKSESGDIHAIETNRNCVNIYSRENCDGQFIRLQTGGLFSYVDKLTTHRWDDNDLVANETLLVGSIGPCLEKCDPQNWAGMRRDVSTNVTIYGKQDYKGRGYTYSISGMQCLKVSRLRKGSIKIFGMDTITCVELHEDATCGGNSVQLRPGYPNLNDLWSWGFYRRDLADHAFYAESVSLCGNSCPEVNFSATTNTSTTSILTATSTATKPTMTAELEEPVTNQSNLHVHEEVSSLQGEERPPVWAMLLIILTILLILGLAGFCGVYIFHRYRNLHPPCYQERCNVMYTSQSKNL